MENLLETIRKISKILSDSELDSLIIEEELLMRVVKKSTTSLKVKSSAFGRIKVINKKQLESIEYNLSMTTKGKI